ncbi:hypothetical protein AQ619_07365 [Caulobacter henricii]|uniref:Uncharacterized protein n=2 Tax=Caulobacter henricii TaxID=69395 RepID=A0A0P0NYL5_9CAUL|nr:hypothetical protein AQ619_07365 [Caulobacter henricii]
MVFAWSPNISSRGSVELRNAAMAHRLRGQAATLTTMEGLLPPGYFDPFDLDLARIDPEVVICADKQDERVFDYLVWGQSIPADIKNFRNTKVLVFDNGQATRRVMGAILLKSPMYFDGARDAHLSWPELFTMVGDQRQKNQAAIDLRNEALKSIYNVGVCMTAAPYGVHGMGKLIASLCFAPAIVDHLEAKFGQPVLGMTTTGGWGGNAAQYDRLNVAERAGGGHRPLFARTHGARPSLNFPVHLFSDAVMQAAMQVIRENNTVRVRDFADFATDPKVAARAFRQACKLVGVPIRSTAANCVAHYFGSVSDACTDALRTLAGIHTPPSVRSIPVATAVAEWRSRFKPAATFLASSAAARLSTQAT